MQTERANELDDRVNGHPENVGAALPELEAVVARPEDTAALVAAIEALGHAWDFRAVEVLLRVPPDHPDGDVRCALAGALNCGAADQGPAFDAVVRTLVTMSADVRDEVRDRACFGLGQLEADTPDVRDALAARLDDGHDDARCEALVALAAHGDVRALAACRQALGAEPDEVWLLELRAAALLADPSLLPSLERLQQAWAADEADEFADALTCAIRSCTA